MLEWTKLLSDKRYRKSNSYIQDPLIVRNAFEADYDRIVGSSSVRRLQDKAQVFPLQENDVARTRLTHSIEVSAMARSLGKAVGKQLESKGDFETEMTDKLAGLLQVAGLIHDLGNPPFGHYGETVIRDWFSSWFESNPILSTHHIALTPQQKNDFLYFDGNVQNLRIVTRLQTQNDTYGANFTYATLATIMKYPWASDKCSSDKKKFGYFYSEQNLALEVRRELGLADNVRHPATYLLEAADDIIYMCDDIEDGVKKGYIDWQCEFELIWSNLRKEMSNDSEERFKAIEKLFSDIKQKPIDPRMDQRERDIAAARNFRNFVQVFLFREAVSSFIAHYEDIMSNKLSDSFELLSSQRELTHELKSVTARNCFNCREVLSLELSGRQVINGLLDIFVPALIENDGETLSDPKTYPGKLFKLISQNFIFIALHDQKCVDSDLKPDDRSLSELIDNLSVYGRLQLITDFISGMTDSYAFYLYQDLSGARRPSRD